MKCFCIAQVAAIISIALLDYADFALIVALLLVNATISYVSVGQNDGRRQLPPDGQ